MIILKTIIVVGGILSLTPDISFNYLKLDSMEECKKVVQAIAPTNSTVTHDTEDKYISEFKETKTFSAMAFIHACTKVN